MKIFYNQHLKDISKGTVIRTATLFIAFINSGLALFGKSPLPVKNEELELFISLLFQMGAAFPAWWYNNSFTKKAIEADKTFK